MGYGGSRPGAGRRKGVKDKINQEKERLLLPELGIDPLLGMVKIAKNPKASLELRGRMFSELAQYVHAKRRSVEVSNSPGTEFKVQVELIGDPNRPD